MEPIAWANLGFLVLTLAAWGAIHKVLEDKTGGGPRSRTILGELPPAMLLAATVIYYLIPATFNLVTGQVPGYVLGGPVWPMMVFIGALIFTAATVLWVALLAEGHQAIDRMAAELGQDRAPALGGAGETDGGAVRTPTGEGQGTASADSTEHGDHDATAERQVRGSPTRQEAPTRADQQSGTERSTGGSGGVGLADAIAATTGVEPGFDRQSDEDTGSDESAGESESATGSKEGATTAGRVADHTPSGETTPTADGAEVIEESEEAVEPTEDETEDIEEVPEEERPHPGARDVTVVDMGGEIKNPEQSR